MENDKDKKMKMKNEVMQRIKDKNDYSKDEKQFDLNFNQEKERRGKNNDNHTIKESIIGYSSDQDCVLEINQAPSESPCFCPILPKEKKGKKKDEIYVPMMTSGKTLNSKDRNHTDKKELPKADKVYWEGYSPLHSIMSGRDSKQLKRLLELGYVRKKGTWSYEEEEQLSKNIEEFLDTHEVKDFQGLIFVRSKEDRIFRRRTQFVLKMCKGISRTGSDINNKILYYFGRTYLKRGRISDEEWKELNKLHVMYGNSWKKIGFCSNRNHRGMSDVFHQHEEWNKGRWQVEETKRLLEAVTEYTERKEAIPWLTISSKVKTRSRLQCRARWFKHHSQITNKHACEKWLKSTQKSNDEHTDITWKNNEMYKLVKLISELSIDDEFLIDWNELMKHFDNVPSAAWLKLKFQAVCKEVPHSHRLEFSELIEQLIDRYGNKTNDQIIYEKNDDIQITEKTSSHEIIHLTNDDDDDDDYDDDDNVL